MFTERSAAYDENASISSVRSRAGSRRRAGSAARAPEQLVAEVVDAGIRQRDLAVDVAVDNAVAVVCQHALAAGQPDLEREVRLRVTTDLGLQPKGEVLDEGVQRSVAT
jgi:hypothetical protein